MKNYIRISAIALLCISASLGSCKKDYVTPAPTGGRDTRVTSASVISSRKWSIHSFLKNDKEYNYLYKGDIFQFSSNGVLSVAGPHSDKGSWKVGDYLSISFNHASTYNELNNKNWRIVKLNYDVMVIKGLDPLDHSTEEVTFVSF